MLAQFAVVFLSSVAVATPGAVYEAVGTINNADVADTITRAAIKVDGSYYLQNVQSGEWLHYDNNQGRQFFPIADESQKTAFDFDSGTLDGSPYSRISITDGRCFSPSAQWWYQENGLHERPGDWLAPLYDCAIGAGASDENRKEDLRDAKQQWFIVPVHEDIDLSEGIKEASGSATAIAANLAVPVVKVAGAISINLGRSPDTVSSKTSSAKLTQVALVATRASTTKAPVTTGVSATPSSKPTTTKVPLRSKQHHREKFAQSRCLNKRAVVRDYAHLARQVQPLQNFQHTLRRRRVALRKRADTRIVYISSADHAEDMQSRCLHGTIGIAEEPVQSTRLEPCDKSTLQQWLLIPA